MTLRLLNSFKLVLLALLVVWAFPVSVGAQSSLSLSVTPPLFQLGVVPEQAWESSIKVINSNPFDLTVYATPVNFIPVGEEGRGRFLPIVDEDAPDSTLAQWLEVSPEPIVIPKEQSADVPFILRVPKDPPPGGHFAAILIGTKPPKADGQVAVRTSQMVSSLLFLRVAGDVLEQGKVREFSTKSWFSESPQADFDLRFENSGNVHLRPQGAIEITNMWGKSRGRIPINEASSFGNVLPGSIRKFEFTWTGASSFSDIGRYKAEVVLTYGSELRQNLSQVTYFWVIPVRGALIALLVLLILIFVIRRAIRSYVRHMLLRAGIDPEEHRARQQRGDVAMLKKLDTVGKGLAARADGLRVSVTEAEVLHSPWATFFKNHWFFFVGIPAVMMLFGLLFWFLSGALAPERPYEATVKTGGIEETYSSEAVE